MTPPQAVIQWLTANNMRAISTQQYVELLSENVTMKKQIEARQALEGDKE